MIEDYKVKIVVEHRNVKDGYGFDIHTLDLRSFKDRNIAEEYAENIQKLVDSIRIISK
jgi:hypothetical protein